MKLLKIKEINGKLELLSGLHIGSGETTMRIGGADSTVIKHPRTGLPYIPGSSLKGKIRSLLELESGLMMQTDGKPLSVRDCNGNDDAISIVKLFGMSADATNSGVDSIGPTRLSFADCQLAEGEDLKNDIFEIKSENSINRIESVAISPRFIERVVSGLKFEFKLSMKVFEEDNEDALTDKIMHGLALLERDALGGSGSRGYGKVKFILTGDNQGKLDQARKDLDK